jgi:hypothetical protein
VAKRRKKSPRKVRKVTRVKARITGKPQVLAVGAQGVVSTAGWKSIGLSQHFYVRPPSDGIQGFDFVGNPPKGPAAQVVKKVRASRRIRAASWVKGVRVVAAQNKKVARV